MGTIANTPLVSNKVFKAIQPYQTIKETTGTIIYANKYADVAEVPMPDWVKSVLDSDAGTVGMNPLVQLQGKLQYLAEGPWYTDCRNGMLYIHNKKFREDSIHTYVYQSENGEVIRISFETQRIKHVDVAKALGINPKTKQVEQERSATEEIPNKLRENFIELNDATKVYRYQYLDIRKKPRTKEGMQNLFDYQLSKFQGRPLAETYGYLNNATQAWMNMTGIGTESGINGNFFTPGQKEAADWQVRNQVGKQNQTLKNNQISNAVSKKFKAQESLAYDRDWKESMGTTMSPNKQVRENTINERVGKKLYDITGEMGRALYQAKKSKKDPRPALKAIMDRYLGVGATHTYVAKVWKEEYVDPTTYSGNNTFNYNPRPLSDASYGGDKPRINLAAKEGYEGMQQDPNIMVLSDIGRNPKKPRYFQVKIYHLANHKTQVSLGQELTDWALREAGYDPNGGGWKKDKLANASGTWEEKKLVVKMDVVGRPSLATSQILTILNVGQRWSGNYYVKTCTHRMDASEGYICSLELSKNKGKPGVHTREDKIDTKKIIKDNSNGNTTNRNRGASKVTDKAVQKVSRSYQPPKSTQKSKAFKKGKKSNSVRSSKSKR